jgi:carbamoyl-phosphate synthase large subunit
MAASPKTANILAMDERMNGKRHLLVTSAARKIPLLRAAIAAARKLSPEMQVLAGDIDPDAPAQYAADAFWAMPRTDDTALDALIAGCRERGIGFVLPTRDGELAFWARHRARFANEGIAVLVSPEESVTRCLDKLAFARFGQERGLPFIPAYEGLEDASTSRYRGPYAVKERFGAGSRAIGLNLDAASAREHAKGLTAPIFQPFIEGTEISVDAWLDRNHKVKGLVLRRRDRVVDGESQVTTTFRDPVIENATRTALEALQLSGPVVMQILIDKAGQPHIIECNSRFGGASTAGIAAGLDSLYWSLAEAAGHDVAALPFARISGEVRQVRLPADTHFILPE